jgi:hypothetical protein
MKETDDYQRPVGPKLPFHILHPSILGSGWQEPDDLRTQHGPVLVLHSCVLDRQTLALASPNTSLNAACSHWNGLAFTRSETADTKATPMAVGRTIQKPVDWQMPMVLTPLPAASHVPRVLYASHVPRHRSPGPKPQMIQVGPSLCEGRVETLKGPWVVTLQSASLASSSCMDPHSRQCTLERSSVRMPTQATAHGALNTNSSAPRGCPTSTSAELLPPSYLQPVYQLQVKAAEGRRTPTTLSTAVFVDTIHKLLASPRQLAAGFLKRPGSSHAHAFRCDKVTQGMPCTVSCLSHAARS